jgi:hypothetical protein
LVQPIDATEIKFRQTIPGRTIETTTVINRVIFFQTLRTKYDNDVLTTGGSPLLLTAAVSAGKTTVDTAYEIDKISQ